MRAVLAALLWAAPAVGAAQATPNALTDEEKKEGYVLLFNGQDLTGFKSDPKRGHHKWIVQDGAITLIPIAPATDPSYSAFPLRTVEEYDHYVLKVDFKTHTNPESGHSAVILRSAPPKTYEPSAVEVSIYGPARQLGHYSTGAFRYGLRAPSKAAVRPAGEWNTFVLTVSGKKIDVELNGERVNGLDLAEWDKPGKRPDGSNHLVPKALKDLPERSAIGFRDDFGIPIWFRNVKLKPLKAPVAVAAAPPEPGSPAGADNTLTEEERRDGWRLLFNGRDLDGFRASSNAYSNHGKWIAEGGTFGPCLFGGQAKYVPPLHLFTREEFENYVLKVDVRSHPDPGKGHSGVILRVGRPELVEQATLEVAIYGAGGRLGDYCTGSFRHGLRTADKAAMRPAGEWNTFVITVDRNRVEVVLNGEKVNALNLEEWGTPGKRPDGSDHKLTRMAVKDMPPRGAIGFREDHGSPVWFKNLKLKPLP